MIKIKAAQTSSFVAFVTGPINSLRAFLLLPKAVNPLVCDGGDRTLHGATRNLCLCGFFFFLKTATKKQVQSSVQILKHLKECLWGIVFLKRQFHA